MKNQEVFLERMNWPEVDQALQSGWTTVIIPCGAVEQHGPHLPLFTDAEHGTRLGYEVALRLGRTLVAPTIRVGCSEHHMGFPGTISLEKATFQAVCRDYCTSLARHGFRKLCLLPTHGGNFGPLAEAVQQIDEAVGPDCRVIAFTDLMGILELWKQLVEDEAGLGKNVGGHADIAESSVMLQLHPDLVRRDEAREGYRPESEGNVQRIMREGVRSVSPNGILGDARGMSEAIGVKCIEALADVVADSFAR